jgi:HSP20 family molecular chaperone IbpA
MEYDEAVRADVTPEEFFLEKLPALHRERLDNFERFCETTLRFSIRLRDVDEQFSVELRPDGARAREGEFIDFPVATIEGSTGPWKSVKRYLKRAFEEGERALEQQPPSDRIDDEFLAEFERFDGVVEVTLEFPGLNEPAEFRIVLNDYQAPPDAPTLRAEVGTESLEGLLEGRCTAEEAVQSAELSGDMSLAFELSGVVLRHFPGLEG